MLRIGNYDIPVPKHLDLKEFECLIDLTLSSCSNLSFFEREQTPEECMERVEQDGIMFYLCHRKTARLSLAASRTHHHAFCFIKNPSDNIINQAIRDNYKVIEYVEQTNERVMIAVEQSADSIRYITNPTTDQCLAAVKNHGEAIRHIKPWYHTPEICKEAVLRYPKAIKYIRPDLVTKEIVEIVVREYPKAIKVIDRRLITLDIAKFVIKKDPHMIEYIYQNVMNVEELNLFAVAKDKETIKYFVGDMDLVSKCLKVNGLALEHIMNYVEMTQDYDKLYLIAVEQNPNAIKYARFCKEEVCIRAIEKDIRVLPNVQNRNSNVCHRAIDIDARVAVEFFEKYYFKEEHRIKAVSKDGLLLEHISNQTFDICVAAIQQNPDAIQFAKPEFQEQFYSRYARGTMVKSARSKC